MPVGRREGYTSPQSSSDPNSSLEKSVTEAKGGYVHDQGPRSNKGQTSALRQGLSCLPDQVASTLAAPCSDRQTSRAEGARDSTSSRLVGRLCMELGIHLGL